MNYLWAFMILAGILFSACNGTLPAVTNAALDSAKEAVTLCITMMGVMSFWVGLMKVAEESGIIAGLSKKLRPFLRFLFPEVPKTHVANQYIATNMIANIFGLGWAATPAGLKAMEALQELNLEECKHAGATEKRAPDIATTAMCNFLILNISSLQLIPVNIIAYRGQYGSANPTAIVGPALAATICSTLAAVLFCKVANVRKRH
ncbi:MAG: nucleoside recognition protein [Clostridiales bacterium]|nr:nucleoside recognition protein [Clostridiales bacterium]